MSLFLYDPPAELILTKALNDKNASDISNYEYCNFDQKFHYWMDGFAIEGKRWAIVLPPPTRNGYPFNGIKASVIILDELAEKPMQVTPKVIQSAQFSAKLNEDITKEINKAEPIYKRTTYAGKLSDNNSSSNFLIQLFYS